MRKLYIKVKNHDNVEMCIREWRPLYKTDAPVKKHLQDIFLFK